jgi:4-coumarate--CoA ligase
MASGLQKLSVSKGDVVLLLLPNSIYYPIVLLGVMYLGAVVTTSNPLSSVGEIRKQVNDCGASFAFTIPENVKKLEQLGMPIIVVPENEKDLKHESFSCFFNLIYGNFDLSHKPVIKQEDTAAILYSSGTTGASKGVVLTHRNFIAMVELYMWFQASQYEYSSSKKVYLAVLPMFHLYGLSHFALGLLSLGSTIVVMRKFDIDEAITAIGKYNVTHFNVVPPIVSALTTKAKGVKGNKLQSLKQVISTAAPLSLGTINDFVQAFPNVDIIQVKKLGIKLIIN